MEDLKTKIKQTKARKKGFLKAMPEEQRRLLKMEEHANKTAKRLLWLIPVWFVCLVVALIVFTFKASYQNKWTINAIICAILFIVGSIIILFIHSSYKKKANAYGYSIPDYVQEYGEIKQHISDLKKADKEQRYAQRKADIAEEKARIASEKSAEHVRAAEEHAKAMQESAKQAYEHASSVANSEAVSVAVNIEPDVIESNEPDAENTTTELSSSDIPSENDEHI